MSELTVSQLNGLAKRNTNTDTFVLVCVNKGFSVRRDKKNNIIASKKNADGINLKFVLFDFMDWDLCDQKVTVFEDNRKIHDFKLSEFEIHD